MLKKGYSAVVRNKYKYVILEKNPVVLQVSN